MISFEDDRHSGEGLFFAKLFVTKIDVFCGSPSSLGQKNLI